jgi:hypothetical protein
MIIAGVVGVVVLIGAVIIFSGGRKKPPPRVVEAPPPKAAVSVRDWYSTGRGDGANWARRTKGRGSMAGGSGDPFAKDEVLRMADMQTSNWYNKGLKGDAEGEKRYIKGFQAGVKAVIGR